MRGAFQRARRAQAVVDKQLEFLQVVALAQVRAIGNTHARTHRQRQVPLRQQVVRQFLRRRARRQQFRVFVRHLVEHVVHRKRGHQERALRFHQSEGFGGGKRAVLDGIHARTHRGFNGARRVGMCRHLHTEHVRGVHRALHLVFRHQLRMRVVAGGSNATGRHEFDDASATTLVLAHAKAGLDGRVHAAIFPARMT